MNTAVVEAEPRGGVATNAPEGDVDIRATSGDHTDGGEGGGGRGNGGGDDGEWEGGEQRHGDEAGGTGGRP